jgi:hypothetical protein
MIAIYFDDCLTIGTEESTEVVINALKGLNFGLQVKDNRIDYVNCKIMQTHIIENLEN